MQSVVTRKTTGLSPVRAACYESGNGGSFQNCTHYRSKKRGQLHGEMTEVLVRYKVMDSQYIPE